MTYNFGMGLPSNVTAPMPGTFTLPIDSNMGMMDLSGLNFGSSPAAALPMMGAGSFGGGSPSMLGSISDWFKNTPLSTTTGANGMKTQGMFDMGLGALQGGLGAYLGFKNLGIAEDTFKQNKRQFDLNFGAQQKTTNARLEDRQRSRVAFDPRAMGVSAYMAQNGI